MRRFHVEVTYVPWKGDSRVRAWENDYMLVQHVTVQGEPIVANSIKLSLSQGNKLYEDASSGFLILELTGAEEYRKRLKPEDWLQHDDPNVLALAVANIKFVEAPVPAEIVEATIARANAAEPPDSGKPSSY